MLISIDEQDVRPIYAQIVADIKEQIRLGDMQPGEELPSVRELAESLAINLHTVHRAYQLLRDQRIIILRLGQRARVAPLRRQPVAREIVEEKLAARLHELITDAFHLGLTVDDFGRLVDEVMARSTQERNER